MTARVNHHATGLVLDGKGILLRGPSGAGKSLLTLQLLDRWTARGGKAQLIADDRVDLAVERGHLIAYAPPNIGGLIEMRGRGIVRRPHVEKARIHLVIDMVDELVRLVEEDQLQTEVEGVTVDRCPLPNRGIIDPSHQMLIVQEALAALKTAAKPKKKTA